MVIARVPFGKSSQKATTIRDPLYRYLHRIIESSIVPRFHSWDKVNMTFSFYAACCGTIRARSLRARRSSLLSLIIGSSTVGSTFGPTLPRSRAL
ncbi:hypothetical protein Hanom_Chr13g01188901 [Helianthus anomalus]